MSVQEKIIEIKKIISLICDVVPIVIKKIISLICDVVPSLVAIVKETIMLFKTV